MLAYLFLEPLNFTNWPQENAFSTKTISLVYFWMSKPVACLQYLVNRFRKILIICYIQAISSTRPNVLLYFRFACDIFMSKIILFIRSENSINRSSKFHTKQTIRIPRRTRICTYSIRGDVNTRRFLQGQVIGIDYRAMCNDSTH